MFETDLRIIGVILEHIQIIEERFLTIQKASDFDTTKAGGVLLDAIAMRLQALSENIKSLYKRNKKILANYPEVPWIKIIRFRDFLSHHYEFLNSELIFDTCKFNLPELKAAILSIKSDR